MTPLSWVTCQVISKLWERNASEAYISDNLFFDIEGKVLICVVIITNLIAFFDNGPSVNNKFVTNVCYLNIYLILLVSCLV